MFAGRLQEQKGHFYMVIRYKNNAGKRKEKWRTIGVLMKQIQEWLGHSDFSTTANIYAHLDLQNKVIQRSQHGSLRNFP